MRLLPASLFGRTLVVLALGLLLAQLASAAIHLFDRSSSVYQLASLQIAARVAQTARILNRLPPAERAKLVQELSGPHLRVALVSCASSRPNASTTSVRPNSDAGSSRIRRARPPRRARSPRCARS